jgi:carbonic anhydrase
MKIIDQLLLQNKAWAEERAELDPEFFLRLSRTQRPHTLWIGCSDSRVSVNIITETEPGEIFVHRNIANLVVSTDFNLLSVIEYAVDVLKVELIILCGHENCGGIQAALTMPDSHELVFVGTWLRNVRDIYRLHRQEIDALATEGERVNCLSELSAREQAHNLAQSFIIQRAWQRGQALTIQGVMYSLRTGKLRPIIEIASPPPAMGPAIKKGQQEE